MLYKGLTESWWNRNKFPYFNPLSAINPSAPTSTFTDYTPEKDVAGFIEQCLKWNITAYHLRYDANHEEARSAEPEQWHRNYEGNVTMGQVLKTMRCLQYNSEITDYLTPREMESSHKEMVDEWRKWFDVLSSLCDKVAYAIATQTEEYEQAEWF